MKTPKELKLERELELADGLIKQLRKEADDTHCKMKLEIKELDEKNDFLADTLLRKVKQIKDLTEALEEISRGEGAYDMEPLKHAGNVIDNLVGIAKQALK